MNKLIPLIVVVALVAIVIMVFLMQPQATVTPGASPGPQPENQIELLPETQPEQPPVQIPPEIPETTCGDGTCQDDESEISCPKDCVMKPDLIVSEAYLEPTSPVDGEPLKLYVTIKNVGNTPAIIREGYHISTSFCFESEVLINAFNRELVNSEIGVGEEINGVFNTFAYSPAGSPALGERQVIIKVDTCEPGIADWTSEINETNNEKVIKFNLKAGDSEYSDDDACRDTDGGRNYYKKGIMTRSDNTAYWMDQCYTKGANSDSSSDECFGVICYLQEVACDIPEGQSVPGAPNIERHDCPKGCKEGACIR